MAIAPAPNAAIAMGAIADSRTSWLGSSIRGSSRHHWRGVAAIDQENVVLADGKPGFACPRRSERLPEAPKPKLIVHLLVDHGLRYKLRARNQGEPMRKIAALAALIIPASASASLTPSATGPYVALAYSPLHVGSVIYGYNTVLADAQSSALALCRKVLKTGCRGSIWVQNGWIAYASVHGPRGGVGWGYGASKSFASNTAMKWCLATQHTAPNMGKCGLDLVMPTKPVNTRHARGGHW